MRSFASHLARLKNATTAFFNALLANCGGKTLEWLLPKSKFFPPAELAEPEGIVLFGGKLSPEWLLDAYAHGIFPWPIFDGTDIVVWWSPDPRAIFEFDRFYVSRRLDRTLRSGAFEVTADRDFAGVVSGCATAGDRRHNTWLTPKMIEAYVQLHNLGHAHSVEVWHDGHLAGGVYGVAMGGLFAGESMFHRVRDASKVALCAPGVPSASARLHAVRHPAVYAPYGQPGRRGN